MTMDGKVTAYSTRTGRETRVPPHYLTNPAIAADWSPTPVVGTDDQQPNASWKKDAIETWATDHGIEVDGDATKGDMLAYLGGIPEPTTAPDGTVPTDQTPA